MRLYKCNVCGSIFTENELLNINDTVGSFFTDITDENGEDIKLCPYCRERDYNEGFICEKCGRFQNQYRTNETCDECLTKEVSQ